MAKIVLVVNSSWNVLNFRLSLLERLQRDGNDIEIVAPYDEYTDQLPFPFHPVNITSKSLNPLVDIRTVYQLWRTFRKINPDVILLYTAKPNIYGNLIAKICRIPVISNVAGLGSAFIGGGLLAKLVKWLYRLTLHHAGTVFFQNKDDLKKFVDEKIVDAASAKLLPGSGVDLERFNPAVLSSGDNKKSFVFLLCARMLWDKGIGEYVEAANRLLDDGFKVEFLLLGFLDTDNPRAISQAEMDNLTCRPEINYLGVSDKVEQVIARVDCMVLPTSYREGTPKSLLEAAAMAKPVITTDAPGCRDVVDDGVTGFLCNPCDAPDLYKKMKMMIELDVTKRDEMGLKGREKMVREYDQSIVINRYCGALHRILNGY